MLGTPAAGLPPGLPGRSPDTPEIDREFGSVAPTTSTMRHYERRLPHWEAVGQPLFVTFRLHGSLPPNRVFPPQRLSSGRAFLAMDRLLDQSVYGPLKGFTAHQANQVLGYHGPFWQDESYDHLIRNDQEFRRIWRYIEQNPVRGGLAASPEEFAWSSATPGRSPAAG